MNFFLINKLMIVYLHPHSRKNRMYDRVAQLVEHLPFKERVLGSSPSPVTKKINNNLNLILIIYLVLKNIR